MLNIEFFLRSIVSIIEWIFLIYFIYVVFYSIIFSVAAFFYRNPIYASSTIQSKKILLLIPAYKEDNVIVSVAQSAVNHNYPVDKFQVTVIADSLNDTTLNKLKKVDKLIVNVVEFDISTKVKALTKAVNETENYFDIVVILDADNLMEADFLNYINSAFSNGAKAVQGQRIAKNKSTTMAFLDAMSEASNNHIYRQGMSTLGLDCSLIGSGMAFDFNLFKRIINQMDSIGGFDKDLEIRLVEEGVKVQYLKKAIVLDEKVENVNVFKNQRKRWIYSQYNYLFKNFKKGFLSLFRGNLSYLNNTILKNIQLPKAINIGLLTFICIIFAVFPKASFISPLIWYTLLGIFLISNLISIPITYYNRDFLKAIVALPKVILTMIFLMFRLKKAKSSFIHTPHGINEPEHR